MSRDRATKRRLRQWGPYFALSIPSPILFVKRKFQNVCEESVTNLSPTHSLSFYRSSPALCSTTVRRLRGRVGRQLGTRKELLSRKRERSEARWDVVGGRSVSGRVAKELFRCAGGGESDAVSSAGSIGKPMLRRSGRRVGVTRWWWGLGGVGA